MIVLHAPDAPPKAKHAMKLTVKRIELFVIPALNVDAAGSRACLRVTTDKGIGFGETFVDEVERPNDWGLWCSALSSFIGTLSITGRSLRSEQADHHSVYNLFDHAIHHLKNWTTEIESDDNASEEPILLSRSLFYLSIF
ncbi:hypothetical protein SAMN04487969_114138 [Paenibacillus algorifonticola]|uniref:Uncharacterized protein n=1 Tax=Paenibacillus algorifonticola TaxID=684063 RepID=A0A1I2G365_9BACL|nr:hypothetical protein [Paenibacillus algorifonticola]SFF12075.1 hypothetical protein SAMN04487969_114138 [Paenibacillus algorifonticola]